LEYMAGEVVTQTLNDAFGYDGWSMEVKDKSREESVKDDKGRYHVAYTATVRITLTRSGAFREDCGAGDAIDRSLGTASGHAIKGAITDAMKRAARHFGEKTGNALYHNGSNLNNAPMTLKDAFEQFDVHRAKSRFGFDKDRAATNGNNGASQQTATAAQYNANTEAVKQEVKSVSNNHSAYGSNQQKPTSANSYAIQQAHRSMTQAKPTSSTTTTSTTVQQTPYVANNNVSTQSNVKPAAPYVTPYHAANATANANRNRVSTGSVDFSQYNATPAPKTNLNPNTNTATSHVGNYGKENSNPQSQTTNIAGGGLSLPPRPGTSRGSQQPNTEDGMLDMAASLLAMNGQTDSTAEVCQVRPGVKNPYNTLG